MIPSVIEDGGGRRLPDRQPLNRFPANWQPVDTQFATGTQHFAKPLMGLREFLTLAFRQRYKALLAVLLMPVLAAALYLLTTPVYRATSYILVKTGREYLAQSDNGSSQAAPTTTKQEGINSEITMLTSRAVILTTINAIGIDKLYPDLLDEQPTNGTIQDLAVEKFTKDLAVDPVKLSDMISVSFDADSRNKAELVVNRLIQVYIDKHTEVFAGSRAEGYEESIRRLFGEITKLETQRTQVKLGAGVYDITAQRAALINQQVEAQGHLQDVINREATLNARLDYLNSALPRIPVTTQSTNIDKSDVATHAQDLLTDLRQTEASLATRFSDSYPELHRVRSQIAAIQARIASTNSNRTSTANTPSPLRQQMDQEIIMGTAELAPLGAEIIRYKALLGTIDEELRRIERADLDLRTVTSRIDSLTENVKTMQARYDQARTQEIDLAKQVSVVQVASALASDKQVKPKKLIFLGGGLLAGLLIAGAIVVIAVLTGTRIVVETSIERVLGLPVLMTLPALRRHTVPGLSDVD